MTLKELVGRHLMIGIAGTKVTPETIRIFQTTHAAGLIVFRPNFESAASFKKLLSDLEAKLQRKLLVAVDHEGGRVIHLREGITVFPDNWALGNSGREAYAKQQGNIEAKELRRLGIDVNLAPTLDVLTETFSPNIGIRSYGKDPALVTKLSAARIKAMQAAGISACAKHFPGLGASPLDPHLDLPVLASTWKEMKRVHLKPFLAAIQAGVDAVMTSHPVYPNLDPSRVPVTFSKKIVQDFLRRELGFNGVIFSDDLEMGALKNLCSTGEATVRAVEAGHDMVLLCHDPKAQVEAYQALLEAYQNQRLRVSDLEASTARIEKLLQKRRERFAGGKPSAEKEGKELAEKIAREGVALRVVPGTLRDRSLRRPVPAVPGTTSIIFPRLSSLASRIHIEEEMLDETKFVQKILKENRIRVSGIKIVGPDPTDADIKRVAKSIRNAEQTLFFCYEAHLGKGNRKILDQLRRHKKKAAVILLRDPYDIQFVAPQIPVVTAYGFRASQIRAAVKKL